MTQITNTSDISLALAVWLLHDEYDYIDEPNYISVTGLMKPLRHIVLPARMSPEQRVLDVSDFIASAFGKSIHDSIEKAWTKDPYSKLRKLGLPQSILDRIAVNPTDEEMTARPDLISVHLEQRALREFGGRTIGGKFDIVADGIVQDAKSTSAFAWAGGTRDDEHRLQLSLYRWIDAAQPMPKIREDYGMIHYVFTDWSKMLARTSESYPKKRVETKIIHLLSLDETEAWVRDKLALIDKYHDTPEGDLPYCTPEELWQSAPKFKYFSDPSKANQPGARSTKNFDDLASANLYMSQEKGGKGIVITIPGEPKRCGYCAAFDICTQKDRFL